MQTVQLTTSDLGTLQTHYPVYVDGTKIVIYGPKELGIAQEGWTLIQLNEKEFDFLWMGGTIVIRNIEIKPPQEKDGFIGYGGAKYYDISYVHSPHKGII